MPDTLDAKSVLEANFKDLSNLELAMRLESIADLLSVHPGYMNAHPEHAPSPDLLKQKAGTLREADRAAENKDRARMAERDTARESALLFAKLPAAYLNLQSIFKDDMSYLQNTGYAVKKRGTKASSLISTVTLLSDLSVQQGDESGNLVVKWHRVHPRASYDLQICKGEPTGEDSWSLVSTLVHCKHVVKNLEPGQKYYFRVRCHVSEGTGPWSTPVGRIVI